MPTPRKTSAEHELSGAFAKNPARRRAREREPKPTGPIGVPPDGLSVVETKIWHELIAQVPPKVLTNADRFLLEICVRMMRKLRGGRIHGGELAILMQGLSRMGLTPADRSKIVVPVQEEKEHSDPIAALEAKLRGARPN